MELEKLSNIWQEGNNQISKENKLSKDIVKKLMMEMHKFQRMISRQHHKNWLKMQNGLTNLDQDVHQQLSIKLISTLNSS